jgi:hypothetical protein
MDITNLEAFAPKPKTHVKEKVNSFIIKSDFEQKESNTSGLVAVDTITLPEVNKDKLVESAKIVNKPVIDLYILSRNCTEYIILNEQSNNLELQVNSKLLIDRERHKRTYIKNLLHDIGNEEVEIEAKYFIFKDKLIKDYHLYLETEDKLVIDKFINTGFITLTKPAKIEILRIDAQPYYNHDYCNDCIFTKICQRRKLEKN